MGHTDPASARFGTANAPEAAASLPARFEALDALRGVCALLVVLFHVPVLHALKDTPAFANLQFCVDMFFALSGFVLCHAYRWRLADAADGVRFAAMRLARLWPLHMVMLGAFILLEGAKLAVSRAGYAVALEAQPFGVGHSAWEIVTNALFLQSFGLHAGLSWNGVAWSAAVEFYVSLLFAAVMLWFPQRRRAVFLGLSLAAGAALYALSPHTLFVSTDWGVLRAIFGFFAGCLVYELRARSSTRLTAPSELEILFVVVAIAFAIVTPQGAGQFAFPLVAGALIYVLSFDQGGVAAVMRLPALQKLGLWSYSIYMIHTFIFQLMRMAASVIDQKLHVKLIAWHNGEKLLLLGSPQQAVWIALALSVVLVVPLAALTYRWIEKPALDAARRELSAARPAATAGIIRAAKSFG